VPSRRAFLATGFTAGLGGLSGCILPVNPVDRIQGLVSDDDDATGPPVAGEVRQEQATGWRAGRVWNVSGPRRDASVSWSTNVGREIRHSPVVRDSKVFVAASKSSDGVVHGLDASTGNRLWTKGLEWGPGSVALTESTLLVTGAKDTLRLFDDGDELDRTSTGGTSTIALDDEQAYFTESDVIHAVPQNFQRQGWSRDLEDIASGPATDGDRVYVGTYDDELVAYTVEGDLDWRVDIGRDVTGAPTVAGELVLVGGVDFAIHAVDRATGRPVWRHETDGAVYGSPAVADETVYATSVDGTVRALSLENGRERWRYDAGDGLEIGYRAGPIVDDATVFVGGIGGEITALDAASGEELWTVTVGSTPVAPPTIAEGYVFVGTVSGTIYGIEGVTPS